MVSPGCVRPVMFVTIISNARQWVAVLSGAFATARAGRRVAQETENWTKGRKRAGGDTHASLDIRAN